MKSYSEQLPPEVVMPDKIITEDVGDLRYLAINGTSVNSDKLANQTLEQVLANTAKAPVHLGTRRLNDVKLPGEYYQDTNANTVGVKDYPENMAGSLTVSKSAGIIQTYRVYNSSRVWRRALYTGTNWTQWSRDYNTENKPTSADVGLGNVVNYTFVDSFADPSPIKYCSAGAVKAAYDLAASKISQGQCDARYLPIEGKAANSALLNGTSNSASAVANTNALRDSSGDVHVRLLRANYADQNVIDGAIAYRSNAGSDNYVRFCNDTSAIRVFLDLGNVNNWTATSSTDDPANNKYATAAAVKSVQDQANNKITIGGITTTVYATDWFRAKGSCGLYFQDFGGGLRMTNDQEVEVYGNKALRVNSDARVTGQVFTEYSDKRLKKNKRVINNALDLIRGWKGITYNANYIAAKYGYDTSIEKVGLIAQDVEETLPQLVTRAPFDDDGFGGSISGKDYITVDYERCVPILVNCIHELENTVAEQQNQITELRELVEKLITTKQ